jgi:hypothetical protein
MAAKPAGSDTCVVLQAAPTAAIAIASAAWTQRQALKKAFERTGKVITGWPSLRRPSNKALTLTSG